MLLSPRPLRPPVKKIDSYSCDLRVEHRLERFGNTGANSTITLGHSAAAIARPTHHFGALPSQSLIRQQQLLILQPQLLDPTPATARSTSENRDRIPQVDCRRGVFAEMHGVLGLCTEFLANCKRG